MEYTSQGQGTLNTVLGAVGTYGTIFGNGGIGGLFGGNSLSSNGQTTVQNILDVVDLKTENAILKASIDVDEKIKAVETRISNFEAAQGVINCNISSQQAVNTSQIAQLFGLTKLVIPNSSTCPGWGNVTITPSTTTTTT